MIKNIVLVHGAFADGSSWNRVIRLLQAKDYNVTAVQQPLTSLEEDVAITRHVLSMQQGPAILVGHSYGGVIITVAGNEPNVAGLVYIAAYAPDQGENISELKSKAAPAAGGAHVRPDDQGYIWIERSAYPEFFAGDVDAEEARIMAAVQMPWKVPANKISNPAWRSRPSWYQISERDLMINPELQRFMAKRMGAKTISLDASHASAVSCPREIADLIMDAAANSAAPKVSAA
jgi:pimeloyl-ACP methyl ester carboxylesterase